MANDTAARLRALDPTMLDDLECALRLVVNFDDAAKLIGLAGKSSLWRIAADVPAVRALMRSYSRGVGRPKAESKPVDPA